VEGGGVGLGNERKGDRANPLFLFPLSLPLSLLSLLSPRTPHFLNSVG
jgi:hypothetical protein